MPDLITVDMTRPKQLERQLVEDWGYDVARFRRAVISPEGEITYEFFLDDSFQQRLTYTDQVQHGLVSIAAAMDWTEFLSREERELRVLAAQTGETKAIANELCSAAGRKFAAVITAERDKMAKLLDFKKGSF